MSTWSESCPWGASSQKRSLDEVSEWVVPLAPSNQGPSFGGDEWAPVGAGGFAIDDSNGQRKPQTQTQTPISFSLHSFTAPPFFDEDCESRTSGLAATASYGFGAAATASGGFGAATWAPCGGELERDASRLALAAPRFTKKRKGGADSDDQKYIFPRGTSTWRVEVRLEGKSRSARSVGSYSSLRLARIGRDASLEVIAKEKGGKAAAAVVELAKEAGRIAVDRHVDFSWTPPTNDAVYAHGQEWKYTRPLADLISKYTAAYDITGKVPTGCKSHITKIFAGDYPGVVITQSNWLKARSLAADGRLVIAAADGSAPGERMSGVFEQMNSGLFNGMNNAGNDRAFVSTFRSEEDCKRYCASYFSCVAVRNELVRLMDRYDIDVVTALKRLDNVMSPAKAKKDVLSVLAQISEGFSKVHAMTARELLLLIADVVFDESKFNGRVTRRDLDNGRRILGENGLHSKVIAGWLELVVQKGLGAVNERLDLDNDGAAYLDISVPTPERYLKEDCQGVSYRNRGDPLDYERVVEVGKDLFVGLVRAGVVDTNAGQCGSTGYTYTRGDAAMRLFRDIDNDAFRRAAAPNVDQRTSGLRGVSLHQLVLCTANAFGGSIHHDAHFEEGGILDGALEEGETWAGKFHIEITKARLDSLVAEYGEGVFSKTCDGDHLLGRNRKELNGLLHCLLLPHVQNIARTWSRKKLNDWLFLFFVGAYAGGNNTPGLLTVRDIFVD
ncbi:hypothetical protein ACHAXT_010140 [Thalassiosira profunda]